MAVDGIPILALLLCLVGFHGVFFYGNLARKTAAWAVFQLGLAVFFFQLTRSAGPLPRVLILEITGVGLAVALLLGVFCWQLGRPFKNLEGREIGKRVSK